MTYTTPRDSNGVHLLDTVPVVGSEAIEPGEYQEAANGIPRRGACGLAPLTPMGNTPDSPADRPLRLITAGNDDPKQHPDLEPCTDEERIYLRQALNRARSLESRARGMFAEALIAKALEDSDFGPHVLSPWDLCWEGIEIAIRATGDLNSYTAEGKKSPSPGWSFPAAGVLPAMLDGDGGARFGRDEPGVWVVIGAVVGSCSGASK